jgi:hypothetical protein
MTVIVYDNKNLHITELEETWPVSILFISNKIERPGSKKLTGQVRGNRQSFFFGLITSSVPNGTILVVIYRNVRIYQTK